MNRLSPSVGQQAKHKGNLLIYYHIHLPTSNVFGRLAGSDLTFDMLAKRSFSSCVYLLLTQHYWKSVSLNCKFSLDMSNEHWAGWSCSSFLERSKLNVWKIYLENPEKLHRRNGSMRVRIWLLFLLPVPKLEILPVWRNAMELDQKEYQGRRKSDVIDRLP